MKVTTNNPTPTMLPPPIAGLSSHHLRHQNVASVIGLPMRGKGHITRHMKKYLEFFHGARVEMFDIKLYSGPNGDKALLQDLKTFFESEDLGDGRKCHQHECAMEAAEEMAMLQHSLGDRAAAPRERDGGRETNRDSGRFAILFPSDTLNSTETRWSGHSKWRRRWMSETLQAELQAQIFFVEIIVDTAKEQAKKFMAALERSRGLKPGQCENDVKAYQQRYCTIQSDGSEDDFGYIQLINYNDKVVTNNMMRTFLGARVAQFLASVHPYPHTIYLSRHGQSEYNAEQKIGGDSSLTACGREYARRLAEFSHFVVQGRAEHLSCVTLTEAEVEDLRSHLTKVPCSAIKDRRGVFASGDWHGFGDTSGGVVRDGMRLVRVQRGEGSEFTDAPNSVDGVVAALGGGGGGTTLVFVSHEAPESEAPKFARLWTSSMRRTNETAQFIKHPVIAGLEGGKSWVQMAKRSYRNLDEVYAGEFEGLTYADIKVNNPDEAKLRKLDKLGYRYPRGESYYDIIWRLDDMVRHLETFHEPILIVSHQAVLRMLYSYLVGIPRERATEIPIPLHTAVRIDIDGTTSNGKTEVRFPLGPSPPQDDGQKHF